MRVLVLGGGSIGGLFAAKLHDSHTVEVAIAPSRRQEVRAAIAERGIEISGLTSILAPVPVVAPDFRGVDVVLVCVKDADVDAIAETLSKDSSNEFIVVSAQNGIRALPRFEEAVGVSRAAAMITAQGATLIGPGRVRHAGAGPTVLGSRADGAGADRIRQRLTDLAESLTAAGLPTQVLPDRLALEAAMWRKLAINASINPLTAAHGCVNGEIARDPPLREWAKAISTEVCSVGRASGQALLQPDECWASVLDAAVGTASNRSSMLQDMESGRQLELPAINGAVAKLAEIYGVDAPANKRAMDAVVAAFQSRWGHIRG